MNVLIVSAKNRRNGSIETRRWTDPHLTREDAIAQMGHWLTQLGWQPKEIMILQAERAIEDKTTGQLRMRLAG